MTSRNIVGNNYDKYSAKNPIARKMMINFLESVSTLFNDFETDNYLEVGCGEGHLSDYLVNNSHVELVNVTACDLELTQIASRLDSRINFEEASIYELPYETDGYDLVVCCEVLEHLEEPEKGLAELIRVSRKGILISTPWEPIWRVLNLARGKYVTALGNTPGHVQHFSRQDIMELSKKYFQITEIKKPVPWTIISGQVFTK